MSFELLVTELRVFRTASRRSQAQMTTLRATSVAALAAEVTEVRADLEDAVTRLASAMGTGGP